MSRCTAAIAACLLVASLADASSAAAQPPWLHVPGTRGSPPSFDARFTLDAPRRERFLAAGYGVAYLHQGFDIELDASGQVTERIVLARHFLNPEGVRGAGNIQIGVRTVIEELHLDDAYVVLPGGAIHRQDLSSVQVLTGDEPNVFSDAAWVVLPFERLEPGSTAVLSARRVSNTREWPLPWSRIYYPRDFSPIVSYEVTVRWAAGRPAPLFATDAPELDCRIGASLRCVGHDIPALPSDPSVRSWYDVFPHLVVSEPHDWADLAARERALVEKRIEEGAAGLAGEAQRLVAGTTTPAARFDRLHRFVTDEIRYVSMSHGVSAIEPQPPDRTLARRYGDCKDKVTLLLALARQAGLAAHPVLVGTARHYPEKLLVPSWLYFDHMIACVEIEGNKLCADATSPHAPTGVLPEPVLGSVALDLTPGVTRPRAIETPPFVWEIDIITENRLACEGGIEEVMTRRFDGVGAVTLRDSISGMASADREVWAKEDYRAVMGDKVEPQVTFNGIDEVARPLLLSTTALWPGSPTKEMTEYREADSWLVWYAGRFRSENRHHPYSLGGARIVSRTVFHLCPDRRANFTGASLDMRSEFGNLSREYHVRPDGVEVETCLELPRRTIEVGELDRFRRFLNHALDQTQIWFSLVGGEP